MGPRRRRTRVRLIQPKIEHAKIVSARAYALYLSRPRHLIHLLCLLTHHITSNIEEYQWHRFMAPDRGALRPKKKKVYLAKLPSHGGL
jgi:hypothetical protein